MAEALRWDAALRHAVDIGCEPNVFVTVHWDCAPGPLTIQARMDKLRNKTSMWLRQRTGRPAVWAYAREMGSGANDKGDHLHQLIWVPEQLRLEFQAAFRRWFYADGVRKPGSKPIKFQHVRPGEILITDKLDGLQSYMLKEGDGDVLVKFVHPRHVGARTGLAVPGTRTKAAQSIGQLARRLSLELEELPGGSEVDKCVGLLAA